VTPPRSCLGVGLLLLPLVACGDGSGTEVVLVGDSIAQEAAPFLREQLGDTKVRDRFLGGTAPCDWLGEDLEVTSTRIVVISFTGNSLTPCMGDDAGGFLRGKALVDRYRADLTTMVDQVRAEGAPVILVGQPQRGPAAASADADVEVAGINGIYTELAEADGVTFVDAGAAVEAPDGSFAATLPCLPGEVACGPDGTNPVRNDDGVHLCPGASDPCPVYSSGAFRFADAIAAAIEPVER